MADEECRNCRSWEEDMYWNHFQYHQFSQTLHAGFDRQLAIPEQFTKNLKGNLPTLISLKGPSGGVWQVNLTKVNGTTFFCNGWDEFANDNLLEENDLLIFKYNGASCFDVLIFDGQSLCEKAASYFVRKCGHKDDSVSLLKRKIREKSANGTAPSPRGLNGALTPEKSANDDIYTPSSKKPIRSRATTKKIRRPVEKIKPAKPASSVFEEEITTPHVPREVITPATIPQEEINPPVLEEEINPAPVHSNEEFSRPVDEGFSDSSEDIETKPDLDHIIRGVVHDVPYISSRRLVTEEEQRNVLQLAREALTSNGFMVIMKPTHVSRRYHMAIPSTWMTKHGFPLETQDMILRVGDDMWRIKYYYQKSKHSGGLSTGWKKFVTAHNLQEHDVCVFEPGDRVSDTVVLDVYVFRVHQEGL